MAITRTKSRLTILAPPPSPIPTGTGSRSAANETFKRFLEKSIQLPQLSLPESRFVSGEITTPAIIDYQSIRSPGGGGSVVRLLRSVKEFGAFQIINHEISSEEILSLVNEAKCIPGDSPEKDIANREAIVQVRYRSDGKTAENSLARADTYRPISGGMENIASKLETIGKELLEILYEGMREENVEKLKKKEKESIFSIYRYKNLDKNKNKIESDDNIMVVMISLQIPTHHCQFQDVKAQSPISFDASPHTIVVTLDKHFQEWSESRLTSARSEMVMVPNMVENQEAFFSIELKLNLLHECHSKVISIADQLFIALLISLFYIFYVFISSLFKGS